jgi:hypothetical protein
LVAAMAARRPACGTCPLRAQQRDLAGAKRSHMLRPHARALTAAAGGAQVRRHRRAVHVLPHQAPHSHVARLGVHSGCRWRCGLATATLALFNRAPQKVIENDERHAASRGSMPSSRVRRPA